MQTIDLLGQTFGYWTVIERTKHRGSAARWLCRCRCGTERILIGAQLRYGNTKSCGCWKRELTITRNTTHGHARDSTYWAWGNMLQRVRGRRPNSPDYSGRGITVCKRWARFENFLADMGERPARTSLDRIDNGRGYDRKNCRWATRSEQARNTRQTLWFTFRGECRCLKDWAERLHLRYETLYTRLKLGWSVERAFTTAMRSHHWH